MKLLDVLDKNWWVFVLIIIFLFSYYIRAMNIIPDRLLSFDPIIQYRFTKYLADWGHLPVWDELSYYTGRSSTTNVSSFFWYVTTIIYWFFKIFNQSLMTAASYASAIYGAMIIIPAFLLGNELSNKYGGLTAAMLVGTAPQILVRTFGSSYDTDQFVVFFILLTLYLGIYALRRKSVAGISLAIAGFTAFLLTWNDFGFTFFILIGYIIMSFIIYAFFGNKEKKLEMKFYRNLKNAFSEVKNQALVLLFILLAIFMIGYAFKKDPLSSFSAFLSFAQNANQWIVNVSIAELQSAGDIWLPVSVTVLLSLLIIVTFFRKKIENEYVFIALFFVSILIIFIAGYINYNNLSASDKASITFLDYFNGNYITNAFLPLGRFVIGIFPIDVIMFSLFVSLISLAIIFSYKKDLKILSFVITLLLVGMYITFKGIRFTEYSSAILLIPVSVGLGYMIESNKNNQLFKASSIAILVCIFLITMNIGQQLGSNLGPDVSANWDAAWNFLKTQTPEYALVGTWWDPGHMITGLGERRVIADGAHCADDCFYNINDRITDLGKIMATTDENVSMSLIRKYQGDSPKVYWIASDDLIGKYQWLQYFGINCDARSDPSCPLYIQLGVDSQSTMYDNSGNVMFLTYPLGGQGKILLYSSPTVPLPIYVQGINAALFNEIIYYNGTNYTSFKFSQNDTNSLLTALKPLETQLNVRFTNQSISMTVWIPKHFSYIVIIPPNLRDTVFTRMYMLDGQGLDHFKEVFVNDQVKIFEVT